MRKSLFFSLVGAALGLGAPLGALALLWFFPHPILRLPDFIAQEWRVHLFFFIYMLAGTSFSFGLFGFFLGREADVISEQNRRLALLATRDELTGLANHRYLHQAFRVEFRRHLTEHKPISCLMMDLDRFKLVNDSFGHPFGDHVLRQFALLVKKSIRAGDFAARYGGEEFLCILPHCDKREAGRVAERIRRETEKFLFIFGGHRTRITVSVGSVTSYGRTRIPYRRLIAMADKALYRAKRSGRNKVVQIPLDHVPAGRIRDRG
jgi:diguanylate cyclase (GGDEF)-like protein